MTEKKEIFRYEDDDVSYVINKLETGEYIMEVCDGTSTILSEEEVKYVLENPEEAALAAQNLWIVLLLCAKL